MQKGMGALGTITDLFAARLHLAWFLDLFILTVTIETHSFPFTSHFDSNLNQDQLHLHPTQPLVEPQ